MSKVVSELKFDEKGLIPVIVQDNSTNEVLMMAYMNKEAYEKTCNTGLAHYWSRSRGKLWLKGETSGHFQTIKRMHLDCDSDTILIKVVQKEAACHTGNYSCFYREISGDELLDNGAKVFDVEKVYGTKGDDNSTSKEYTDKSTAGESTTDESTAGETEKLDAATILSELYDVICDRLQNPKEGSYTNYLFTKGLDKILKKVGEETAEVIIAAKNRSKDEIRYEISDLIYHLFVLMVEQGVKPEDIYKELKGRR